MLAVRLEKLRRPGLGLVGVLTDLAVADRAPDAPGAVLQEVQSDGSPSVVGDVHTPIIRPSSNFGTNRTARQFDGEADA